MSRLIDLTGQKFGRLTVLERAENKGKHVMWLCKCECGQTSIISGDNLKSGHTKSCGCLSKEKTHERFFQDLTGQKFGRLTVLKRAENENNRTAWLCECECGNKKIVNGENLKKGLTQSCGCLHNEITSKLNFKDLTGQRFGKLVVLYRSKTEKNRNNSVVWHCKCDCGNEYDAISRRLLQGEVQSCGCLSCSKGELKISDILDKNNINYIREYTPKGISFKARYDFYIPLLNTLIEYDGEQHYVPKEHFGGEKEFKIRQEHDKEKNKWALDNNYVLIRIPYTHYNDLCIEDLLPNISSFTINK